MESKMKEVANLLGVELGEKFTINQACCNPYYISEFGLFDCDKKAKSSILVRLLNGDLRMKKQILDDVEKEYLKNVLRPFKNQVDYLAKNYSMYGKKNISKSFLKKKIVVFVFRLLKKGKCTKA